MKKFLTIIPLVFLLCFTFGCQQGEEVAEEPVVDVEAERAAIQEAFSAWMKANDAKDVDGLVSYFAADAVTLFDDGLQNNTYMQEFWNDTFAEGSFWTGSPPEKMVVSASGDLAYLIFGVQFTRLVEGELKTSDKYYCILVWKKQADNSWKIVAFK
jgi:ketosteroid isomerase-like protein